MTLAPALRPLTAGAARSTALSDRNTAMAAWPAVALVGSYELLMMIIRGAQVPADVTAAAGLSGRPPDAARCRYRPRRCSPVTPRPVEFRWCALSARGFM
jgi:hypothetical protein